MLDPGVLEQVLGEQQVARYSLDGLDQKVGEAQSEELWVRLAASQELLPSFVAAQVGVCGQNELGIVGRELVGW